MEKMNLKVRVSAREIYIFSMYNYLASPFGVFAILGTLAVFALVIYNRARLGDQVAYLIVAAMLFFIVFQLFQVRLKAKRQAKSSEHAPDILFNLEPDGIRVRQGTEKGEIRWDQLYKVKHVAGVYMLYLGQGQAYLIPDSALNGTARETFLKILKAYVPEKKRKGVAV